MELIETHSTRAGHNRVYVETTDGVSVGYIDLALRCVVAEADGYDAALHECLARWAGGTAGKGYTPVATVVVQPASELPGLPPAGAPPRTADTALALRDGADDLALNKPGAAAWTRRNAANAKAPVRNRLFRVLRLPTLEHNWRIGALGAEEVAHELARLGAGWRALHSVPIGDQGESIDHVLIGPAGVYTISTRHRSNSRAWVGEHGVRINGERTDDLKRARLEAERASRLLGDARGQRVVVSPVIVFVGLRELAIGKMPTDVHVTTCRRMLAWFREQPATLQPGAVEVIYSHARKAGTWL